MAPSAIDQLNFLREVYAANGIMPLKKGSKTIEQKIRELAQKAQQKMNTDNTAVLMAQVAWLKETAKELDEFFHQRITMRFKWGLIPPVVTDDDISAAIVANILKSSDYEIIGAGTGL